MHIARIRFASLVFVLTFAAESAFAQPPQPPEGGRQFGPREGGPPRGPGGPAARMRGGPGGPGGSSAADSIAAVTRMFTLDANKDGKLSKDEITDQRLFALGIRADANKDGNVTREELTALFTKEAAEANAGGMSRGPGGGRPGNGGPGGQREGGPREGGPPRGPRPGAPPSND